MKKNKPCKYKHKTYGTVKEARAFVHDSPFQPCVLKCSSLLGPFVSYKEKEAM
jgi:hypothetical protein